MLKKRNAVELSTTVIILVVLGLIVLLVMVIIFSRTTGTTTTTLEKCESKGGRCVDETSCSDGVRLPICGTGKICCVEVK